MKKFLTATLLFVVCSNMLWAQCNIVANPSFESGTTANQLNQLQNATSWYKGCPNPCNGYTCGKTTGNTPDLMDMNTSNPNANGTTSTPNGPHYPYQGNRWAYIAGIESYYGKLEDTINCGMLYKIRIRLSSSEISNNSALDVMLKNGSGSSINCSPSKTIMQISGGYTTSSWDLITDTFSVSISEAAYDFNRIMFEGNYPPLNNSFIDSIGIEAYQLIAGKDTLMCVGNSYQLGPSCGVPLDSGTYHWVSIPADETLEGQEHSSNPIVSPDTTTTYVLAIYDSLNYCNILADTVIIYDRGCCEPLTGSSIYDNQTLSTAGIVTINNDFAINGTLNLTGGGTFVFNGSDVSLGMDANIVVESGTSLEIVNEAHLHACNFMWDEILIENGAEITVNGRSLIEDAEDALLIEDGANYVLSKANFNKNYRHVSIVAPNGSPVFPVNLIDSCLFLCQTTASIGATPVYTNLLPPRTADSTIHGVWAYDVRRLRLGVKNSENYFSNCRFGASAWIVDTVDVQSNTFEDVTYTGISVAECGANGETINIYDNQINRTPTGIYCYDNPEAATNILQNRVDYDGMASPQVVMTGIIAVEITPGDISDPNRLSIDGNSINKAPCGIHTMNLFGLPSGGTGTVYIGEDTVKLWQPNSTGTAHAGILAENLTLGLIIDNTVYRYNYDVNWWETAIRVGSGVANSLICNRTHDIGNGMWFDNDQRPLTTFAKNVMENNGSGLLLNNGKIGAQGSSGTPNDNEWQGTWTGTNYSTHCYSPGSNGNDSPFTVRSSPTYLVPSNNHNSSGAPSAIPVTTGATGSWTAGCAFTAPSFKTDENEEQKGLSDALSILSTSEETMDTDRQRGMQWAGEYGLYRTLLMNEELYYSHNDLASFFSEKDNGSMGQLYRALSDFNRLRGGQTAAVQGNTAHYLTAMHTLQTEHRPEQRLAEVLGILYANINNLKGIGGGDEVRLREIAQLCPIDDGPGVYVARAALLKLDTLPKHYTSECELAPYIDQMNEKRDGSERGLQLAVYPNPNNGRMMVNYDLKEGEAAQLVIYNTVGATVFETSLNHSSSIMEIDVSHVSSGLYLLSIIVNNDRRLTERLSILKE